MKPIAFAAILLLSVISSAFAFDTPEELLKALYSPYFKGESFNWDNWDETQFRSAGLNELFAKDEGESGGLGRLDFDPYIDGQDYSLTKLSIGSPEISGDTAKVVVTFENFGTPDSLTYHLVREADGWKIDDVVNANPDFAYSLHDIMAGPLD